MQGTRVMRTLLAIGLSAACVAPTTAQVTDVEQMPERFVELFRQWDLPALTNLFSADASYVPIVGPKRLDSAQEISGYYAKVFADSRSRNITFRNALWKRYDDVVVRTADVVIDLDLTDGNKRSTPSRVSFVYHRGPDGWKIVHYHGSPLSMPPSSTPSGTKPR